MLISVLQRLFRCALVGPARAAATGPTRAPWQEPPHGGRDMSLPIWAPALLKEIGQLPTARLTDLYPDGGPDALVEEWTA